MTAQDTPNWTVDPNALQREVDTGVEAMANAVVNFRAKIIAGGINPDVADRMAEQFFTMLLKMASGGK